MERVFDWKPRHDEASRAYPIRTLITERPRRRFKKWRSSQILDQGREGACVGFGWTAEALSTPVSVNLSNVKADVPRTPTEFALHAYNTAKTLDPWEGENYEGTSVLAGAKTFQKFGLLKEYRWAFSIEDVIDALLVTGPVVLGIYWYSGMYEAPNGKLELSGDIVGGHCLTAVGYSPTSRVFDGVPSIFLQNSWGTDWGINGIAEIRVSDLSALLDNDGEACVPFKRSYGR